MQRDFITTLDNLSRSTTFRSGELLAATEEILRESAKALGCERVNTWVLNRSKNKLTSFVAYDSRTDTFSEEGVLEKKNIPRYFEYLKKEDIIISNVAREAEINQELIEIYIDKLGITAMIDVPIRSEGKMVGLICFEHINKVHNWSIEERKFTLSISNLISLAYETNRRLEYETKLESIIHEKEVLISEVNHRVKNNMAVILGLVNLQKYKCKDRFHENLLNDLSSRIYSMSEIQNQLHLSDNYAEIDLSDYLRSLVSHLDETYGAGKNIQLEIDVPPIVVDMSKAIPCGLIVNEVLTNSYKYAFNQDNLSPKLSIIGEQKKRDVLLKLKDNGPGLPDFDKDSEGMGRELISELANQIEGEITIDNTSGTSYTLKFTN